MTYRSGVPDNHSQMRTMWAVTTPKVKLYWISSNSNCLMSGD